MSGTRIVTGSGEPVLLHGVGALTLITSNSLYTLPLALLNMEYGSVGQVDFGYLEAGAVIAMVPCVLLYVGLQRFCIRGLTSGVVKG